MPRLGFPGSDDSEPRTERDRFLFVVKIAAVVVVTGVAGGLLLLSGGGQDDVAATNPAVPTITGSSQPGRAEPPPPATPAETFVPPAVGTQMAEIRPKPPATRPKPVNPPGRDIRFVRVGQPCDQPRAVAFTKRYEPVVCRPDGRDDRPRWQLLF